MQTTYAQKNETTQRAADNTAAAVHDNSPQSVSLQRHASLANAAVQRAENPPRPNNTGLPDDLKNGVESLSGYSLDNVRVHYNSPKPATVQALAYTQGTDIHVAPGQEHALPHEAWHVTQQMAGRVTPTTNIGGMPANDNAALEHEADVMGEKAVTQRKVDGSASTLKSVNLNGESMQMLPLEKDCIDIGLNVEPADVKKSAKGKKLVNGGALLTCKTEGECVDKIGSLEKISKKASTIGNIAKGDFWNGGEPKDRDTTNSLNYFYVKITSSGGNPIEMTYSYGTAKGVNPGYVVSVKYGENEGKMVEGSRYDAWGNVGDDENCKMNLLNYKVGQEQKKGVAINNNEYTNSHHKTYDENILKCTDEINAKGWDAYTKLAGEGARFQCVRRNIPWINDNTVFYPPGKDKGVRFSQLWLTWSSTFKKAYDIADATIASKMGDECKLQMSSEKTEAVDAVPGNRVQLNGNSTVESEKAHERLVYFHKSYDDPNGGNAPFY